MFRDSESSPSLSSGSRSPSPEHRVGLTQDNWQPILHSSNQLVLYNPTSHALSIQPSTTHEVARKCLYCKQILPAGFEPSSTPPPSIVPGAESPSLDQLFESDLDSNPGEEDPVLHSRAANYFQLLEIANETASRPSTPPPIAEAGDAGTTSTFPPEAMAEGYFKAFFKEELRLGMGANGSVYLCQHVLDDNPLGHFAVKKIAVGESHSYLLQILREVKLLERLRHSNIITYHHSWLETAQFSAFGPRIPTLHVLMQWAEGGSLDDFIDVRLGRGTQHVHINPLSSSISVGASTSTVNVDSNRSPPSGSDNLHSRSARIRAFRAFQRAPEQEKEKIRRQQAEMSSGGNQSWTAIHLCSAEEVKSLFSDVVEGLAFLHNKSILHLDLKPGNVLLTWDDGRLIPRAMLSDFGTSRDMVSGSRVRSGNTGTMEYSSPESLPDPTTRKLGSVDSKADMWSLGMILHKLLFFYLPYQYAADGDAREAVSARDEPDKLAKLEQEVLNYPGFKQTSALVSTFDVRRLPHNYLRLLESLLNVVPAMRPGADRIVHAVRGGWLDPVRPDQNRRSQGGPLIHTGMQRSYARMPSPAPLATDDIVADGTPPARSDSTTPLQGNGQEKRPQLLRLPSPPNPPSVHERTVTRSVDLQSTSVLQRTVKSVFLSAKVLSLSTLCNETSPNWTISSLLMALAIADMSLVDNWTLTLLLALLHIMVVWLGRGHLCLGSNDGW